MNSSEKTLIILTPGFAKDEADTTCIPMQQSFVRTLNEKYPQLNIIIFAFQYPYENKVYNWSGNLVISFDGRNRGGLSKILLRRRILDKLNKIRASHNVHGVLSFWYGECASI